MRSQRFLKKLPLEDFASEEFPFNPPGDIGLITAARESPDFFVFRTTEGVDLIATRRAAVIGLARASVRAAHGERHAVGIPELFYFMGWPQPSPEPRILSALLAWGIPFGLASRTLSDRAVALPLAGFLCDLLRVDPRLYTDLKSAAFFDALTLMSQRNEGFDVERAVHSRLSSLNARQRTTFYCRLGMMGHKKQTLLEVGRKFGVSRERARQWETYVFRRLMPFQSTWVTEMVGQFMQDAGRRVFPAASRRIAGWEFLHAALDVPISELGDPKSGARVLALEQESLDGGGYLRWGYRELFGGGAFRSLVSWRDGFSWEDLEALRAQMRAIRIAEMDESERVRASLFHLGRPAHYSEVAAVYNELFPDRKQTDRNVHATLGRMLDEVAYVGRKGFYGLKELGACRPETDLKTLVAKVLREQYDLIGCALPFPVVLGEVRKYRPAADETSVRMLLGWDALKDDNDRWRPAEMPTRAKMTMLSSRFGRK